MTQAAIRTAVYNAVNGVTNAGKVYDYAKWSASWDTFLDQFKTTISGQTQIRGWMVSYEGMSAAPAKIAVNVPNAGDNSLIAREQRFKVFGFMGLNDSDATEKTFAALAEAVVEALDDDATLHDDSTYLACSPAHIEFFGTLTLGSVLCNNAEIIVTVTEAVQI